MCALLTRFARIADRCGLSAEVRATLLGGIRRTTLRRRTRGQLPPAQSADQAERLAHVIGIDVAAQAFYGVGSPNAASRVWRPNTAPNGEGPDVSVMLTALPGLLAAVRRHVEALSGGSAAAS